MADLSRPSLRVGVGLAITRARPGRGPDPGADRARAGAGRARVRSAPPRSLFRRRARTSRPSCARAGGRPGCWRWTRPLRASRAAGRSCSTSPASAWWRTRGGPGRASAGGGGCGAAARGRGGDRRPPRGRLGADLELCRFASGSAPVILRLATAVPDLVEEMRDHRELRGRPRRRPARRARGRGMALCPPGRAPPPRPSAPSTPTRPRWAGCATRTGPVPPPRRQSAAGSRGSSRTARPWRAGELAAGIVTRRNGLSTIVGYARLVEQAAALPAAREAGTGIPRNAETLEGVIRRFMEFMKQETLGRGGLRPGTDALPRRGPRSRARPRARKSPSRAARWAPLRRRGAARARLREAWCATPSEAAGERGHVRIRGGPGRRCGASSRSATTDPAPHVRGAREAAPLLHRQGPGPGPSLALRDHPPARRRCRLRQPFASGVTGGGAVPLRGPASEQGVTVGSVRAPIEV
jgi:hypothetical protein